MGKRHLLVVDDQPEIGTYIKNVAEPLGYDVALMVDTGNFREIYDVVAPDTIIVDMFMPDRDGIEIIRELVNAKCRSRILIMSGSDEFFLNSVYRLAQDQGIRNIRIMKKPLRLSELRAYLIENEIPSQKTGDASIH